MSPDNLVDTETQEVVPRKPNRYSAEFVERNTHRLRQFFGKCRGDTDKCPRCPFTDEHRASFFADPNASHFIDSAVSGTLAVSDDASTVSAPSATLFDSPDAVVSGNVAGVDPSSQTCSKGLPDHDSSPLNLQVETQSTNVTEALRPEKTLSQPLEKSGLPKGQRKLHQRIAQSLAEAHAHLEAVLKVSGDDDAQYVDELYQWCLLLRQQLAALTHHSKTAQEGVHVAKEIVKDDVDSSNVLSVEDLDIQEALREFNALHGYH